MYLAARGAYIDEQRLREAGRAQLKPLLSPM
jgi:hypothetical protein